MIELFRETKSLMVLSFLLENPEKKLGIREIARATGVSPTWVSKTVGELKEENLVREVEDGSLELNLGNPEVTRTKKAANLISVYSSGLVDHLIRRFNHPEAIVLFGSYAKGTDLSTSDVDLAIICPKRLRLDLERFEKKLKRSVNVNQIERARLTDEFKNTLANGIVLYGYLKVA